MPPKADPRDWDRLFRPGAPRRGGPLRALANVLLLFVVLGLVGGAAFFALRFGLEQARENATATEHAIETANAGVMATRTARALEATATTAAVASAPTPETAQLTVIGRGTVLAGGNLRSEPVVSPDTIIGQICAGDAIEFIDQRTLDDGSLWYRIRITTAPESCSAQRVTVGSLGWASSSLLSAPTP